MDKARQPDAGRGCRRVVRESQRRHVGRVWGWDGPFIPGDTSARVKALLTVDGKDTAEAATLRVNEAAKDLKKRTDEFARKLLK